MTLLLLFGYDGWTVWFHYFSVIESLTTTKSIFTKTTVTPSESSTTISYVVSSKSTTGMVNIHFPYMLNKSSNIHLHIPYQLCSGVQC